MEQCVLNKEVELFEHEYYKTILYGLIQNGIDRREVQFGNAGVAETNRKTFTRKPAGSERPIHPHATPQLVQSERLQVDWSRGLQDRRSTSHTFTPQKNGDIDVDN
jgi:hypothetical protein